MLKIFKIFGWIGIVTIVFLMATSVLAGTITSPSASSYAWSENIGWLNFKADNSNVSINSSSLSGYIWNDNYGWINLNNTANGWGIKNNGSGVLSGYAWGENIGPIDFSGSSIDLSGSFKGIATGSTITGRINFECGDACHLQTDWRVSSGGGSGGGGGGGGMATCGNGIIESGEVCDTGNSNGFCPSTCSTACSLNNCQIATAPPGNLIATIYSVDTDSRIIKINISATNNPNQSTVSTSTSFEGAVWSPFNGQLVYQYLIGLTGQITVYIKLKNSIGESPVLPITVQLQDMQAVPAKGRLVKTKDYAGVYFVDENNNRHLFSTRNTYATWYPDFSGLQVISQSEMEALNFGYNMTVRPGSNLIQFDNSPRVYAVLPGNKICQTFANYGPDWQNKIAVVQSGFESDYKYDADCAITADKKLPDSTLLSYVGSNDIYLIETGRKRKVSNSAFTANLFRTKDIIKNVPLSMTYDDGLPLNSTEAGIAPPQIIKP